MITIDELAARRDALAAYMDVDRRATAAEDALKRARVVWDERRHALAVALREFVPLAQHIGDPDAYLAPLQATLARSVGLEGLIDDVAADVQTEAHPTLRGETAHAEQVVSAGIWLEEHLEGAGWLRAKAVRIAAQAHGYSLAEIDSARADLVATESRHTAVGEEWRLMLDSAFEAPR